MADNTARWGSERQMTDRAWKAQERRVARMFGTLRNSLSGGHSKVGTSSDTLHGKLYIECKYRQRIAVIEWFQEIIPLARKEGKIPVLCLKAKNRQDDYVVVRIRDLKGEKDARKK